MLFKIFGAGDQVRTDDIFLGKEVLYQLSYTRIWYTVGESNPSSRRERAVS